ncbi:hypothetical protein [Tessaracoccus palaemonis]|uniref:Uncharacterized protein n=1 Tax=Tessaracoccus palaemonis TaxID=2829499 RepID=A0ABX8SND8_9ACTN|nr:hypothetical protein [Tessaracoccus palaemonis]QXT64165.1 hypothetical protein KDB89_06880 [Tessaracoccus palaemonis]
MLDLTEQAERLLALVEAAQVDGAGLVWSDLAEGDAFMAIDDCLQFTLLGGVVVPEAVLGDVELTMSAGWDPDLGDRTQNWIDQHRLRAQPSSDGHGGR